MGDADAPELMWTDDAQQCEVVKAAHRLAEAPREFIFEMPLG